MEQEHHQDLHQVTQFQVQLSEQMLEITLLYMYTQQKMTLKIPYDSVTIVLS